MPFLLLLLLSCHSPPVAARITITITITPVDIDMIMIFGFILVLYTTYSVLSAVHSMYDSKSIPVRSMYWACSHGFESAIGLDFYSQTFLYAPGNIVHCFSSPCLVSRVRSTSPLMTSLGLKRQLHFLRFLAPTPYVHRPCSDSMDRHFTRQILLYRAFCSAPIQ